MSAIMGIALLALFCLALFIAVPFLLSMVMLVPLALRLRRRATPEATVVPAREPAVDVVPAASPSFTTAA